MRATPTRRIRRDLFNLARASREANKKFDYSSTFSTFSCKEKNFILFQFFVLKNKNSSFETRLRIEYTEMLSKHWGLLMEMKQKSVKKRMCSEKWDQAERCANGVTVVFNKYSETRYYARRDGIGRDHADYYFLRICE